MALRTIQTEELVHMYIRTGTDAIQRILLLLLGAGVAVGSCVTAAFPEWKIWNKWEFLQAIGTGFCSDSYGSTLLNLMSGTMLWFAVILLLGVSLVGYPTVYGVLLLRGIALGSVLVTLYQQQGAAGILTACVFVVPFALAVTFLYAAEICSAAACSAWLQRLAGGEWAEKPCTLKTAGIRLFLFAAGILLLCIVQAAMMQYCKVA